MLNFVSTLLLITLVACDATLALGNEQCKEKCIAYNTDAATGTRQHLPCKTIDGDCPGVNYYGESPSASSPLSTTGEGWYLFRRNGHDYVALNVSWEPSRDGSEKRIQAYQVEVYDNYRWKLTQSFCLGESQNGGLVSPDGFNFPCYGLGSDQLIEPGDVYQVMITPYPISPRSESNVLEIDVKIPDCSDKQIKNVHKCVERAEFVAKINDYICDKRSFNLSYNIPKGFGAPGNALFMGRQNITEASIGLSSYDLVVLTGGQEFDFKTDLPMSNSNFTVSVPLMYDLAIAKFKVEIFGSYPLRFVVNAQFPSRCWEVVKPRDVKPIALSAQSEKPQHDIKDNSFFIAGMVVLVLVLVAVTSYVLMNAFHNHSKKYSRSDSNVKLDLDA